MDSEKTSTIVNCRSYTRHCVLEADREQKRHSLYRHQLLYQRFSHLYPVHHLKCFQHILCGLLDKCFSLTVDSQYIIFILFMYISIKYTHACAYTHTRARMRVRSSFAYVYIYANACICFHLFIMYNHAGCIIVHRTL